jgi:hypothetical protein
MVARIKYGDDGYYTVEAATDTAVKTAMSSFTAAQSILHH